MAKKLNKTLDEEFARLYCKEIGVVPERCSARWATWTVTEPTISIQYYVNSEYHEDRIEIMDAFNLISKYLLKKKG